MSEPEYELLSESAINAKIKRIGLYTNVIRLLILAELSDGKSKTTGELSDILERICPDRISSSFNSVQQQLCILRANNVVHRDKIGKNAYYRLMPSVKPLSRSLANCLQLTEEFERTQWKT